MGLFRSFFARTRTDGNAPAVQAVPLPGLAKPGLGLLPLIGDCQSQPRLRALLEQNPHRWVFVLVNGELRDFDGTIAAPVTDLRDGVLGYLPVGKLAGWARAFVNAGSVICPAQLQVDIDGESTHVAVDGDFIRRQLDEAAENTARPPGPQ